MNKFYFFLLALLITVTSYAQCVIDTNALSGSTAGMYPTAPHLPHIVRDSLYAQTVQGKIQSAISQNIGGFIQIDIRVDSVRLDSVNGLPIGINWLQNPAILRGGEYGCVEFSGTTSDTPGTYQLRAVGMAWAHLSVPLLGIDVDTFLYGSLNRFPPFGNYFVVVDSAPQPLSVTFNADHNCFGAQFDGSATVFAAGGSPTSPYTYLWNTGITTYTMDSLATETYYITVTSGNETVIDSVIITEASSPVTTTISATGSSGNDGTATVVASGGTPPYRYFWDNGDRNDTITDLNPGTYFVTVVDSFGCSTTDSVVVDDFTGIVSTGGEKPLLNLFPNPANNVLNVVIESTRTFSTRIEAIDMTGRIVYSTPVTVNGRLNFPLNIQEFTSGVYILQLTSEKQNVHQRFVVMH